MNAMMDKVSVSMEAYSDAFDQHTILGSFAASTGEITRWKNQ
jgi:hypothetical protein